MILSLAVLVMAPLVTADGPAPTPARVQQLRKNRFLVRSLVQSGLALAGQDDPIQRATSCSTLAQSLGDEIERAADDRENERAAELAGHLQTLLKKGVAANLQQMWSPAFSGSAREPEIRQVGRQLKEALRPLESRLRNATDDPLLQQVHQGVADGLRAVEQVGRPKLRRDAPPKGEPVPGPKNSH
jgi:hypothetical protein